jgi:hypothetical protein
LSSGMKESRRLARQYREHRGTPTVGGGLGEVDPPAPPDIRQLVTTNAKNRWISLADVHDARLRRGILNGRLRVTLTNGARVKCCGCRTTQRTRCFPNCSKNA